jgi:metal-responsive CopG/Arc/MetJ family transcriptional regulator
MIAKPAKPEPRVIVPMPHELIKEIDEYRWANRLPSRAETIRQLVKQALHPKK